jgi:hypothetical protein
MFVGSGTNGFAGLRLRTDEWALRDSAVPFDLRNLDSTVICYKEKIMPVGQVILMVLAVLVLGPLLLKALFFFLGITIGLVALAIRFAVLAGLVYLGYRAFRHLFKSA